jgi:hypothetical protein
MNPVRWIIVALVVLVCILLYVEYIKSENYHLWNSTRFDLYSVGQAYREYQSKFGKPPSKVDDLKVLLGETTRAFIGLTEGRYQVVWGVRFSDDERDDEIVLGWVKEPTSRGIMVLMVDGKVRDVSAEKFAHTPVGKPE